MNPLANNQILVIGWIVDCEWLCCMAWCWLQWMFLLCWYYSIRIFLEMEKN